MHMIIVIMMAGLSAPHAVPEYWGDTDIVDLGTQRMAAWKNVLDYGASSPLSNLASGKKLAAMERPPHFQHFSK